MTETTEQVARHPRARESLDKVRPAMAALEPDELVPVNTDPFTAVSTARAVLPKLLSLRDQLVELPNFDPKHLDNLETYALATLQAHTNYLASNAPPEQLQERIVEATMLREQLLSDATALANRGYISGASLDKLKGSIGFRNVASDVLTLANLLRGAWSKVSTKTGVTEAELERAEMLGEDLNSDIGVKTVTPAVAAAVTLERQQAFTLLTRAYDQLRRAVAYLRWDEEDADDFAPSFYAGRQRRSSSDSDDRTEPATTTTTSTATASTAAMPANPATMSSATPPAAVAPRPGVGLPGADPFVR